MSDEQPPLRFTIETIPTVVDLSEPVPGELRREPVSDADTACPHCGGREWLLVERRAEPEAQFTRWAAVGCASCGRAGGWEEAGSERPDRQDDDEFDPVDDRVPGLPEHPTAHDVARLAPFGVFGPPGEPELRRTSTSERRFVGVTVAAGGVEVTTDVRPEVVHGLPFAPWTPEERARRAFYETLRHRGDVVARGRSHEAWRLAVAEERRGAHAQADAATASEATFGLDGEPHAFLVVATPEAWAAVAHLDDLELVVTGEGAVPDGLALRTLQR